MYKNRKYRQGAIQQKPVIQTNKKNVESSPVKTKKVDVQQVEIHEGDDLLLSQGSIPASQPPTQRRYLSQRSLNLCKTQSKPLSRAPNSYFEMILMKAGVDLDQENVVLAYDNVTFVNRLCNLFNKSQGNPKAIENFIEGFREYLNTKAKAIKLLTGCSIFIQSTEMYVQSQDSVTINILMVDTLQQKVIEVLLDKIEEISRQNNTSTDIILLPLLLSQLRLVASSYVEILYNRIIEIFDRATPAARNEIILNIEFVLGAVKHDDFVNYLLDNCSSREELLNKNTVEVFMNLSLNLRIKTRIKNLILQFIKECNTSLLPFFIKFLLTTVRDDDNSITELISHIRDCLCFRSDDLKNESNLVSEIFVYISQGLIRSRKIFNNWLKIIQNVREKEFKSIDFIMLLILISVHEEKSNYIENLIRRWIKQEVIKINIVIEAKSNFFIVLEEHTDLFIRLFDDFLREKNQLLLNFAKQAYRIFFTASDAYRKKLLTKLVELICDKSVANTTVTLDVLKNLNDKYVNEMQNCGLLLLPLLDRVGEMNLTGFRTVLELLCSISYPQPPLQECDVLKDHIDMLVKKQVISQTSLIKKQGIIGVVQLVYHISCTEESDNEMDNIYNLDNTYNSVDELPEGRGKLAANYITRVFSSTSYCAESLALFYDEMAIAFSPRNKSGTKIDRHFVIWLCDLVTNYFQNYFVVENVPSELSPKLAYKNCINTLDDKSGTESELVPIAINISGPILRPCAEAASSVITLSPLFNLMRVLHFIRYKGSLESINAILGCAVILPETFDDLTDKDIFEEYDKDITKKIIDIHFYLINWYREIIGAFAGQNDQMIRRKVLLRIRELIKLENTVQQLLSHPGASNYIPPMYQFSTSITVSSPVFKKPLGIPKKTVVGGKSNQNQKRNDDEKNHETNDIFPRTQNEKCTKYNNIRTLNGVCRQMDFNIMLILREKLILKLSLPNENIGNCIGLLEFKFILSDLVDKLESITGTKKVILDNFIQFVKYPADLIDDLIRFLPTIMDYFQQLGSSVTSTIKSVNDALDNANLFTDEFNCIKVCYSLCLRLFSALFSWSDFEDESNQKLLKAALNALNDLPINTQNNTEDIHEIAETTFNSFMKLEKYIVDLQSAVYLYNLLSSLKRFTNNNGLEKSIHDICTSFLSKKWYNCTGIQDKGVSYNMLINELLNGIFKNCDVQKLKKILGALLDEIKLLKRKDDCLKTFPNINKVNFPMIFKHFCSTLITILNEKLEIQVSTTNELRIWEQACEILNSLLNVVKSLDIPRNFSLYLKYSHMFLKIFIQRGLPVFERSLKKNPERVNDLLKSLQITTRFLHNLCCHSKAIKQDAIVAQIPFVRQTVENLVFKVKAALAANTCSSVFWMGDLKNKDLYGDVILSQGSFDDNDSENELPDSDNDFGDVEDINETVNDANSSKTNLSQSDSL